MAVDFEPDPLVAELAARTARFVREEVIPIEVAKARYSAAIRRLSSDWSPSRCSCGACTRPTVGSEKAGARRLSQCGDTA